MKTASVATVQHDLKRILQEVASGATFRITRHGQAVAVISPVPAAPTGAAKAGKDAKRWLNPAFGALAGTVKHYGDILSPLSEDWDAHQ